MRLLRRRHRPLLILAIALGAVVVIACGTGAVSLSPGQVLTALGRRLGIELPWPVSARQDAILWSIRIPRVLLAAAVGAGLGCAGAAMQGVVRNPLADPGLVGVSNGAALAAVAFLVMGGPLSDAVPVAWVSWLLPAAAFGGALSATLIALGISRVGGRTSAPALLLGGVALAALAGAGVGLFIQVANDAQLRSITFWTLGSLGGATWPVVTVAVPLIVGAALLLTRYARDLDRLLLGEAEARHLGIDVERLVRQIVVLVALAVGTSVAFCGVIGFVGLVVPHLVRGWLGPAHRTLLPASALGGAILLVLADLIARSAVRQSELPVGVITALAGAPVLLMMVRRGRGREAMP